MSTTPAPIDIGSRLELMLDEHLIARFVGDAALRLHQPVRREVCFVTDQPGEGNAAGYLTVIHDGGEYRMYHRLWNLGDIVDESALVPIAVAISNDGLAWRRPDLGLVEYRGSRRNNIVLAPQPPQSKGEHGFSPFIDANPACRPEHRYKAIGGGRPCRAGVYAFISSDGLRWRLLQQSPIITEGAFDSQNLAFWDAVRGEYRAYVRDFRNPLTGKRDYAGGIRCVRTATSPDFVNWTPPEYITYPGAPDEHLYTNQITPYPRAPHLFVGFPARYVERGWNAGTEALPELEERRRRAKGHPRYGMALTDGLFMSSRDGRTFKRWGEPFIPPGLRPVGNWVYGDNFQNWGIVQTRSDVAGAPDELSFYATEGYWRGNATSIRRYTLRLDGFVSVHTTRTGGELITHPLTFTGSRMLLNFATSAAGSLRIEIQQPDGTPISGFSLADSPEMFGDALDYVALWHDPAKLTELAGQPVRLRFVLHEADLYAFRFTA